MASLKLLVQIAFRNLFASWMNLIIGGIIFFGTLLVVTGGSMLDSIITSMGKSIIGSASGDIQVYSGKSKDAVSVFGSMGGEPDLTPIPDFAVLEKTLTSVPNVKSVTPMGINAALITSGNTMDMALEKLRDQYRSGHAANPAKADAIKRHIRHMVELLERDFANMKALSSERAVDPETVDALKKAHSDEFWAQFDARPLESLEFLENKIAPLDVDADLLPLRYAGTDLEQFAKTFDRMRIVDGQMVPHGQRGLLMPKFYYEERLKLKTARRLDKIHDALADKRKTLRSNADLREMLRDNQSQTREVLFQLDDLQTADMVKRLQASLSSKETDPSKLLVELFTADDSNFNERYAIFYKDVAPLLDLYRIRIGDTLTIKSFTRTGYVEAVNVKVWGTFEFSGIEKSPAAGSLALMDIASFRRLYGYLSSNDLAEIESIKKAAGAKMVGRDEAEADLFGAGGEAAAPGATGGTSGGKTVIAEATPGLIDEKGELQGNAKPLRDREVETRVFPEKELHSGVVLSAAVMLKDPSKLEETERAIVEAGKSNGLELKTASWREAAGFFGQFILGAELTLYAMVFIIFVVVLVIMNNAMMMATMQRNQEIGTLRAIGAQRGFVLTMVLTETMLLGVVFGGLGALLGTGIVNVVHHYGIPATTDVMYFFFSGPRLRPTVSATTFLGALIIVLLVSTISTFYPAFLATRVSPVRAMQTED